ncbi:rubredoxin [Alkalispirillum mobile]|uniref:Rubredoxin n=1 Tax=Alkalispirillum mobile TaxID=85925 RepID=A0A498C693_9GAMM|nr:rubredoxin [Alkalispirillum mobile]RLK48590.1 rubredoxin [Alkalispirillum mobile]
MEYRSWMCVVCGWIYDEEEGLPEEGIKPGTRWEEIPDDFKCPECGATKAEFDMIEV